MNRKLTRKKCIFSCWDATDEELKQTIFNEFKSQHKGCYTKQDLLDFLEKKLARPLESQAKS